MSISFLSENDDFFIEDFNKIKKWITKVIQENNCRVGNINYFFCSDEYLLNVNRKFLNHDTYTDIITFDYVECNRISGDILISVDRVKENAKTFAIPFSDELKRVVVHGVLHLLGQGDKTDEEALVMRKLEDNALSLWITIV